jgi:hypothetical protein
MKTGQPLETEYAGDFGGYISQVTEDKVLPVLESQLNELDAMFATVNAERETYRYAEGKWSIREIVGHLIDGERVFGYRAFCIARGEKNSLPGFDQDDYMLTAPYHGMPLKDLLSEFRLVREANIAMLKNLDEDSWTRVGTANDSPVSVRALAFVMAGHLRHHMGVLKERYEVGNKT